MTPWSKILLENLVIAQLVKFHIFCGTRRFIIVSKEPSTGSYPESDEFSHQGPNIS